MTVLLFPRSPEPGEIIDLRAHYYESSAIFLRANAAAWALALACNWTLDPLNTFDPFIIIPAAIVILSLIVAQSRRPLYHAALSIITLAAITFLLITTQGPRIECCGNAADKRAQQPREVPDQSVNLAMQRASFELAPSAIDQFSRFTDCRFSPLFFCHSD